MTLRLAEMLASFSWLALAIAIAVVGLACHRHRKRGGDKCFGITAWIALLYLLFTCIPYSVQWAAHLLASSSGYSPGATLYIALGHCQRIADGLWFALFAVFTTGVWRTARKLPRRSRDSASERQAVPPLD
jgi:amino acid permease